MSTWWVVDATQHKRGPFSSTQLSFLLHLGSLSGKSLVFSESEGSWKPLDACESLRNELAQALLVNDSDNEPPERLPLSQIPPLESDPCQDTSCPKYPSCDLVYIWDRKEELWLTFDEYVQVCSEVGLTDGLPDRVLASSTEQIEDLLRRTDEERIENSRKNKVVSNNSDEECSDPEKEARRLKRRTYRERKRLRREAGLWVKTKENPNIYISSLPGDVSVVELMDLFKKAGQLKEDLKTGEPRLKLYGNGDGLVTFANPESVKIAIELFNEYELRPGCFISVQEADFGSKDQQVNASISLDELRARAQVNRDSRRRLLEFYRKERELRSGTRRVNKVVVFQNCFDPRSVDYSFIEDELENLCSRFGSLKKVVCIKDSLDGFVCVRYDSIQAAEACVATINDSEESFSFLGRPVSSFIHDGRDLYSRLLQTTITTEEGETDDAREMEWEEFLYEEGGASDDEDLVIRTE